MPSQELIVVGREAESRHRCRAQHRCGKGTVLAFGKALSSGCPTKCAGNTFCAPSDQASCSSKSYGNMFLRKLMLWSETLDRTVICCTERHAPQRIPPPPWQGVLFPWRRPMSSWSQRRRRPYCPKAAGTASRCYTVQEYFCRTVGAECRGAAWIPGDFMVVCSLRCRHIRERHS